MLYSGRSGSGSRKIELESFSDVAELYAGFIGLAGGNFSEIFLLHNQKYGFLDISPAFMQHWG
jgi:hypothetical protein